MPNHLLSLVTVTRTTATLLFSQVSISIDALNFGICNPTHVLVVFFAYARVDDLTVWDRDVARALLKIERANVGEWGIHDAVLVLESAHSFLGLRAKLLFLFMLNSFLLSRFSDLNWTRVLHFLNAGYVIIT